MAYKEPIKYLSKLERKRFDLIIKSGSIKQAALTEGVSPQLYYNWLYKFRTKYKKRRGWINSILSLRRQSDFLKMVLSERRPLENVEDENDE